jgi:hypothetical protein
MRFLRLLLGVIPPSVPAAQTPSPPFAEVPFTLYQNAVILPAVVNGRDTVQLLLDTGWGPVALVSSSATRLGLAVDSRGGDGLGRAQVASLAIGDAIKTTPLVEVSRTEALAPLIGPHDFSRRDVNVDTDTTASMLLLGD